MRQRRAGIDRCKVGLAAASAVGVLAVAAVPLAATLALPKPHDGRRTAEIEVYAAYDGQRWCKPAQPGTIAFARLLTTRYPGTGHGRIKIPCGGGVSEHKDGRAFDWGVCTCNPHQKAQAKRALQWLLATDGWGNQHAIARRLGIMYIIWNRKMWRSYRPWDGWQPYEGSSPHTDHMHFSLAKAGAKGLTSFWTGEVADLPGAWIPDGGGTPTPSPTRTPTPTPTATPTPAVTPSPTATRSWSAWPTSTWWHRRS